MCNVNECCSFRALPFGPAVVFVLKAQDYKKAKLRIQPKRFALYFLLSTQSARGDDFKPAEQSSTSEMLKLKVTS